MRFNRQGTTSGHVHLFRKKFGKVLSFADTTRFWLAHNGCSADPDISWLADVDPEDGTRIRKKVYSQCNQGVRVMLYEIQGGGHTWPGGPQYLPEWMIGINSKDLDPAEVIWDFFDGISMQN
jgi:polyhydroxybutyrate depolymerase